MEDTETGIESAAAVEEENVFANFTASASSAAAAAPTITQNHYNISERNVHYSNDLEYRSWIRKLFCMIPPEKEEDDIENQNAEYDDEDIDPISRDEQDYNEFATEASLNYIYKQTESHPLFQKLYDLAAAAMFSLDRSIGLAVLFSYDYMALFHQCLCCFFESPGEFSETNTYYVYLYKKLT